MRIEEARHLGLLNENAPSFSGIQGGKRTKVARCNSLKCTDDKKGILEVIKNTKNDICPDCGNYLRWSVEYANE